MPHSVRAVIGLVFPFKQIINVLYPCEKDSESGHGIFMFAVDCLGSTAHTLFGIILRVCFWFHCSRVPARLCQCTL